MEDIPQEYKWLTSRGNLPRMVSKALELLGTKEISGDRSNPVILEWAAEVKDAISYNYQADSVPWCGLFMALCARRAGKTPPPKPLWALNWSKFGVEAGQPMLGDVLTFVRGSGGHVGLYVGEDSTAYHVLGGNHADCVCFTRISKKRLKSARRPPYMKQPETVKMVWVTKGGEMSTDEA